MNQYAIRVSPADVGQRVTLRYRTNAEPPLTDVVGWIRSWSDGLITVERRDGTTATVAEGDLVAGKVLPPPRPR